MAIKANAKRAIRVSERKRLFNVRRLSTMRDEVKSIKKLVLAGDTKGAEKALSTAYQAIDKAAQRGVIKDNTASRKKSRLYAFITKAAAAKPAVKAAKK
jgi:small subunit ribosomal protein S20